jgi:pimeloyl-ACP methyl ester carboxylesterase
VKAYLCKESRCPQREPKGQSGYFTKTGVDRFVEVVKGLEAKKLMSFKIFIHGLESSDKGTKSVFFKQKYPDMVVPHFRGSLPERMRKLEDILSVKKGIRLVGSSFGGLMGTIYAMENESRVEKLILLAPAINLMTEIDQFQKKISVPVWVYHGSEDDVIPLGKVEAVARDTFTNLSFQKVKDDHFLHQTFKTIDWDKLLS